jgi:tetratricopeptide (TPR) repeat protein
MNGLSKAIGVFATVAVLIGLGGCSYLYHAGFAVPPEKVPDGKTASEYYELGVAYKGTGWTEQSREALNRAIKLDGDKEVGRKAKRFLETKLPRDPAAAEAVQLNIKGFNSQIFDKEEAEKVYLECIKKYPRFEWAYSNLGSLYVQEEKYKEGEDYLKKALEINPSYVNAWLHLAGCKKKENDLEGARSCLKKALELDPDDSSAKLMSMTAEFAGK